MNARLKACQQRLRRERERNRKLCSELEEFKPRESEINDSFKLIKEDSCNGETQAIVITYLMKNYNKLGNCRWNPRVIANCIILERLSPKANDHLRTSKFIKFPSKEKLRSYIGSSKGEVGVTDLAVRRLLQEVKMRNEMELYVSLTLDEMTICPKEVYDRNNQTFRGKKNMGGIIDMTNEDSLANRVLGYIISGLSTHYR